MSAAQPSATSAALPARTAVRYVPLLVVLTGAQFMIWIDNTILTVALQVLSDPVQGLGATPEELEWSMSSFTLAFAALMLMGGNLADRYGCKQVFILGMLAFAGSSAWAAWAPDATHLIAARAVMGVGSALVVPTTLAMIRRLFDGERRARAVMVWSACGGLAIAAGPLLGGYLLERYWWGSVFLVNIPVVLLVVLFAFRFVPTMPANRAGRLDVAGLLTSTAGLGLLVYAVIEAGRTGDWLATSTWVPAVAGVVLLAGFAALELRLAHPSIDLTMFRIRPFTAAGLGIGLVFFGLVGSMFYSVFYLQGVRELTPWECGVTLAPVAVGVLVGSPIAQRLERLLGFRVTATPALVAVAGTLAAYGWLDESTDLWRYGVLLFVQGFAMGLAITPLTGVVVAVLPEDRAAAGAAINAVLRQLGSVFGIAVLGSLLASGYRSEIEPAARRLPPAARDAVVESATGGRLVADRLHLPALHDAVDQAFLTSMHGTTMVAAVVCLLGAALVLWGIPNRPPPPPRGPAEDAAGRVGEAPAERVPSLPGADPGNPAPGASPS